MVPLKKTFGKTRRQVRDLSKQFGKEVNLVIEGEETELDRTLVDKIQDPLVHLVRNALDHGIEAPETRREKGKDEEGTLTLSAFHESGDVVIEISDDGAGIDPDDVLKRAVEKELVDPNEELTEDEIYMLLFEPGFSTTDEVTDVSGRGVGMDVVRKNVESIRGSIEVDSEIDQGTTFRLKIPLTLSIINGMIMKLDDERFVIPTTNILRSLSPEPEQITTVEGRGDVLNLRGELISLCRLNRLFDMDVEDRPFEESLIVIVKGGGKKVGLQVDDILGQQEVVIKSLGVAFEELRGVSGAAILGDGNVGLILDTQTLEDIV
jgi:two-component system chemotaxis sensor kinase CheA